MLTGKSSYLLNRIAICKYVLHSHVELAHVVFPKSILVPAHGVEDEALYADNRHFEGLVPFWVEGLVDG